jgi:hypothetical protein
METVKANTESAENKEVAEKGKTEVYGCVGGAVDDQESGAGVQERVR